MDDVERPALRSSVLESVPKRTERGRAQDFENDMAFEGY